MAKKTKKRSGKRSGKRSEKINFEKIPKKDLKKILVLGKKISEELTMKTTTNKAKLKRLKSCVTKHNCKRFTQKKQKENCITKHCNNEVEALVDNVTNIINKNISKKELKKELKKLDKLLKNISKKELKELDKLFKK